MALNKAPNPAFSNWLEGRQAGREEISGQDGTVNNCKGRPHPAISRIHTDRVDSSVFDSFW